MTWSPLACGLLSGKYDDGVPLHSRAALKVNDSDNENMKGLSVCLFVGLRMVKRQDFK